MENNIAQSTISAAAIGEKLRKSREGKSLTIDQIRKETRIHSDILIALENGRGDEVLSPTYVKSFLKKYSAYLGFNAEEVAKEYASIAAVRQGARIAPENILPGNSAERTRGEFSTAKFLRVATVIGLAVIVAFFILVMGKAVTRGKGQKAVKTTISRSKTKSFAPSSKIAKQTTKAMQVYLILKVNKPVLVKLKKDGVSQFERVLPKGSVESFIADNKISLYVAKAEAIELTLNGKPLDLPRKGVIKELEITNKGIKIK